MFFLNIEKVLDDLRNVAVNLALILTLCIMSFLVMITKPEDITKVDTASTIFGEISVVTTK